MSASLSLHHVSVSRGPRRILSDVDLLLAPGRRVGIVGPNGVGKSTLLGVCGRSVVPDQGAVRTTPPSATVGLLAQEPDRGGETVAALIRRRAGVTGAEHELEDAAQALADGDPDAPDRYDRALERWTTLGAPDFDARLGAIAARLDVGQELFDQRTASLSGGEAARVGLMTLLTSRFDVYLLDEPTNDLDLDGLAILEEWVLVSMPRSRW